jgi:hypothetical protein
VIEQWQGSSIDTSLKCFEFFFTDINTPSSGSGVLIRYRPGLYIPSLYNTSEMYESVLTQGLDGSINQMISYSDGPFLHRDDVVRGRAKAVDNGTTVTVSNITRTSDLCPGGDSVDDYYSVAFIANKVEPYYSTAMFGLSETTIGADICGLTNVYNYGHFKAEGNTGVFEADGIGANDDNHPTMENVNLLYTSLLADAQMTKTVIDAIDIGFESTGSVAP